MQKVRTSASDFAETGIEDEFLERLYDVALDPAHYGDLLDTWERMTGPRRRNAPEVAPIDLGRRDFQAHFRRLAELLDRSSLGPSLRPEEIELSAFRRAAAFCIDSELRLLAVNDAAHQLFGLATGGRLDRVPLMPEDIPLLQDGVLALFRAPGRRSGLLRMRGAQDSPAAGRLILFQLRLVEPPFAAPFVIAVSSELKWPDRLNETLRRGFGLTEAEIEVLRSLTESRSPREIADLRDRSIQTVRAQIKSLQQKTETRSQGDLLRFALSAMDLSDAGLTAPAGPGPKGGRYNGGGPDSGLIPIPVQSIQRPDGRIVEFLVLGDTEGRAVMYLPGLFGLTRWMAEAEALAEREGLRVIVPIRPGYGCSTPLRGSESRVETVVGDMAALLDHLGVRRVPMITQDDDLRYAVIFALRHPGRLMGVLAASAMAPMNRHVQFDRMGKWHRFIYTGARYTPSLMPFMVRAGFAMARRLGKPGFIETIYHGSPSDYALARNPEAMDALSSGSEITLSDTVNAADAFAAELLPDRKWDWTNELKAMQGKVPIIAMHGQQDLRVPAVTQAEMRRDYPWIIFNQYENAGQLVLFHRWREMILLVRQLQKAAQATV
ncbi:helix-turn-helix transcriptional regulator [Pseudooceanicola sp. 216_PA32_1]|uniref:Helix-turn-helix transcriptional regulator n=1 Tax=Pseudooceanicola pacificus TaxID=2676438 RepID=A0A844WH14_9RHOB|nr:alpha/beta fold hydrolase [Pseudooceanicola pacificus]MWB79609.1 helix-turn-helix transcriptional regulator [Pseudooceanicola pacificus]